MTARIPNLPASHAEIAGRGTLPYRRYPDAPRQVGRVMLWGHVGPSRAARRREAYLAKTRQNEDKDYR